ncbi:MAG: hypothetical protein IPL69_19620 [Saprospiraceae bacterium]|nr:hypothetical protein [Candidatus Brachybacter algidus]
MAGSSRPIVFQTIGLPVQYCPNSAYYNCGFQFWTCTGGGPSTYADAVDSTLLLAKDNSVPIWEIVFAKLVRIAPIFPALLTKDVLLPAFPTAFL